MVCRSDTVDRKLMRINVNVYEKRRLYCFFLKVAKLECMLPELSQT